MSGETPATHLARLKTTFPAWTFWKGEQTGEFWAAPPPAVHAGELVNAGTLAELEAKLGQIESGRDT